RMLTGTPPFQAATGFDTVWLVLNREPVPPTQICPKLSQEVEAICLKCLAKEPGQRYASALALAEDLCRLLSDEPVQGIARGFWARWRGARILRLAGAVLGRGRSFDSRRP